MNPGRRHLRAVADPAPEVVAGPHDDQQPPADAPPTGLLADALAWVVDDGEQDASVLPGPGLAEAPGVAEPKGNLFLELVERAEKISPLHGSRERMAPLDLLRLIGGASGQGPGDIDPVERTDAIKRLVVAAWDVVRCGAVDDEPDLRRCLVDVCTRLAESDAGCAGAS